MVMPMIHIHTDSTSDLGHDLAQRFNIHVIPLYVVIGEKSYIDGLEITTSDLFRSVQETGKLPKTSATPIGDFSQAFSEPGDHIYIGISSRLSATVRNAQIAADNLPGSRIFVIDSMNLSTGIGMLAIRAAELRDRGFSTEEIVTQINEMVPKVRTSFVIETLDYLYKGGRCSAMQNLMGSLLHIRPVIKVQADGTLGVKDRIRGTRAKALQSLISNLQADLPDLDSHRIFITHTQCPADALSLKDQIQAIADVGEVLITDAGSVIASHCGPNTIGVLYMLK